VKPNSISIVLVSDEIYLPYVWPLLRDLKRTLSYCPPITLFFDGRLDLTRDVEESCLRSEIDLRVSGIAEKLEHEDLNTIRYITRATFGRIFAADILHEEFERILYLDIDLLVIRDFSYIFDLPLNQILAAVPENFDSMHKAFGTFDIAYFNAGVLLIDTKKWKQERLQEQCLKVIEEHGPFNCQDQDVLNLVFKNRWQVLPPTTNVMVSTHDHSMDLPQLGNPAIVHFVGEHKPWNGNAWTRWHGIWIQRNSYKFQFANQEPGRIFLTRAISFALRSRSIRHMARSLKLKDSKLVRRIIS
jgi:lipopolysaccharide biosynthesis glycosyltransferase